MAGPLGFGSPNIFGAGNPIGAWVDPRRNQLQGLAAGLLAGDPGEAFRYSMAGAQADASIAKDKAQEIEKASQQNMTTKWLNDHGYSDLAPLVEAGQGGVAIQEAVRRMQPGYGQDQAGSESWFGNLVPIKNADGSISYAQVSNKGRFKPVDTPQGVSIMSPVQQLNTGTGFTAVDKFGNPTGAVTPIDNSGAAFGTAVGKGLGEQVIENRTGAQDAQKSLSAAVEARKLLDSGVITGFGANVKLGLGKALQQVGVNLAPDAIANTEAFVATRAQEVGRLIKMFGAGTGLSDADREFATKAAAGSIDLNEESIRRILDINERAARNILAQYNNSVQTMGNGAMPQLGVGIGTSAPSANDPLGIR